MIKAIMIIWMGTGNAQVLSTQVFDSSFECETAKTAIVKHYDGRWARIKEGSMECISYGYKEYNADNQ